MKVLQKMIAGAIALSIGTGTFSFKPADAKAASLLNAQELVLSMSSAEQLALSDIASELGFDSAFQLTQEVMANDYSYDSTNIYDLTGDGALTAFDAQFVLNFLHGVNQYKYDYTEMDGDGDGKIDIDDCYAYLTYATQVSLGIIQDNCKTTHKTRSYTPETMTFRKYNASTGNFIQEYSLTPATTNINPANDFAEIESGSFVEQNL